ncbi:pyruvate kinase [Sphingomonas astaxanthinifaciens]|uniref:Pyruvate kinase n=1 Tax=Sphingomonas astaxanthinifaciens DSM 22298 TaxID=1123267 RepID=A0ABQ5Z8C8_9SPHN|nr:pyruvate kinase [Sphingomonas astaxanthinifaciens]GLR48246.1 pyruvate kinase [Sphingomonas astaxanthinifaciens DSM 22298]
MNVSKPVGPRERKVRILATLGPASGTREMIAKLMHCGADAFRINMSHGDQAAKAQLVETIRSLEEEYKRPTTILFDLQGPKLRVGKFAGGTAMLETGARFQLDDSAEPGTAERVELPHPELFAAVREGDQLLIDDGKIRLRAAAVAPGRIETIVEVGGKVSNNKGVNVPDVLVPIPALTEKDRDDLQFALSQKADFIALSFVQRAEDVIEARELIGDKAALMVKIEKPAAIERLEGILEHADAVMVARGDLGVELPAEAVPPLQKMIVARARELGKPVVVATQMLESMITSPTPTRAEVSDVANAIYDGADAVMLSAESAAGQFPVEAVAMMDRIGRSVEADPNYAARVHFTATPAEPTTADALAESAGKIANTVSVAAMVCYTSTGSTARRIARERGPVPLLVMTASKTVARRMGLVWGVHAVHTRDVASFEEMVGKAKRMVLRHKLADGGDRIIVLAGVPFGTSGSTNVLHVVRVAGDELDDYGVS